MKKRFFYFFILMLVTNISFSQIRFGTTAGFTLSTFIDDEGKTFNSDGIQGLLTSMPGFYAGFFAENRFSEKGAVHFELDYALLGGTLEAHFPQRGAGFRSRVNMHHLLLPVSAKYYIAPKWNVYGGLNVGLHLDTKFSIYQNYGLNLDINDINGGDRVEKELEREMEGKINFANLGVHAGSEYQFSRRFSLNAKYNYTFTNMSSVDNTSLRLHYLMAGINYYFSK